MLVVLLLSATNTNAQITIGSTNSPHTGAVLDLQSTDKGLKLPEVELEKTSEFQLSDDGATAAGMIVFNTNASIEGGNGRGVYMWDGTEWILIRGEVFNTVIIDDMIFMDRNLGADPDADPAPSSYAPGTDEAPTGRLNGHYYQWGRVADGHQRWNSAVFDGAVEEEDAIGQIPSSSPAYGKFIINKTGTKDWRTKRDDLLWTNIFGGKANPCPGGYRVPTKVEWEKVIKKEPKWSDETRGVTLETNFFLPAAGERASTDGTFSSVGFLGYYWSSTCSDTNVHCFLFQLGVSTTIHLNTPRADGIPVRCIKN